MTMPRCAQLGTLAAILVFGCSSAAILWGGSTSSAAGSPSVTVSPAGPYRNGQTITVGVAANSLFAPDQHINIIECSDIGGAASGLPKSIAQCDGNTIQGGTIVIGHDGSFTEKGFVVYSLPNQNLAETAGGVPVCNTTHPCVLYVGQNQEDFTRPKLFSAPFTVSPTAGSTPTSAGSNPAPAPATPASGTGSSTTPATSAAVTTPPAASLPTAGSADPASPGVAATADGQLAFTGVRPVVAWLFWLGSLLVLLGSVLRRVLRGSRS
jgi:hypothetical protein